MEFRQYGEQLTKNELEQIYVALGYPDYYSSCAEGYRESASFYRDGDFVEITDNHEFRWMVAAGCGNLVDRKLLRLTGGAHDLRSMNEAKAEANRAASNVLPITTEIRKSGATTLRAIADALNARGVPTPRGGRWHAMSVRNVLARS